MLYTSKRTRNGSQMFGTYGGELSVTRSQRENQKASEGVADWKPKLSNIALASVFAICEKNHACSRRRKVVCFYSAA